MGPGAYGGGSMNPGRVSYPVKVPGIVPGAAPMGAGLVWSTGGRRGHYDGGAVSMPETGGRRLGVLPRPGEAHTIGKAYTCQDPEKKPENRQK